MINKSSQICWFAILVFTLIVWYLDYLIETIELSNYIIYVDIGLIELFIPLIVITIVILIVWIVKFNMYSILSKDPNFQDVE